MARPFTIQLEGLRPALDRLKKSGVDIVNEVDAELADGAVKIEQDAVRNVPVDTGLLSASISYDKISELNYEVVARKKYAPYVEFGTVTRVQIPAGVESYAAQFKGKGIRKTGGMRARPFMFPALFKNSPLIFDKIKKLLKKPR